MQDLIGEKFHNLRKALKLTQEALALQLGVSQQHISHIENGTKRASEPLIKHLCLLFNTTETWLTTGKGEMFLSTEEIIKNQIGRLGERAFSEALIKLLNDNSLEVLRTDLAARSGKFPGDPALGHIINFLVDLWSLGDERLQSWALVQFERSFPEDIKEKVQKELAKKNRL